MAIRRLALCLIVLLLQGLPASAEGNVIARIDTSASRIEDFGSNLHIELTLSRPVPWRVFTLDAPRRIVIDFDTVDFADADLAGIVASDCVSSVKRDRTATGWSRLVIRLNDPMRIETAGLAMVNRTGAVLKVQLAPTTAQAFTDGAGAPDDPARSPDENSGDDSDGGDAARPAAAETKDAPSILRMVRSMFGSARPDEAG